MVRRLKALALALASTSLAAGLAVAQPIEAVVRHAVSAYLLPAAILASALFGGLWWRSGRRDRAR